MRPSARAHSCGAERGVPGTVATSKSMGRAARIDGGNAATMVSVRQKIVVMRKVFIRHKYSIDLAGSDEIRLPKRLGWVANASLFAKMRIPNFTSFME